jgi:hypothetical protein
MAVVSGTVNEAFGFSRAHGAPPTHTVSAAEQNIEHCYVGVTYESGTYAAADNSNFSPATVIQNTRRNGKTVTILSAACVGAGDENGALIFGDACTVSANVVTNQLLQEDLSTERADGAMSATWNRNVVYAVSYYQAAD